ncbi:Predicted acyltransferase [Spirosomataceae bacterium TFI 002]|nr:Predicted acyltransferase [Spirosomataceae bacterium TFI 002]
MKRILSIDIYRGLVMFLMMAECLRLYAVSESHPESSFWSFLAFHQSHVPWVGCSLHDLIQPSFSFLVGVALPFSLFSRKNKGQSSTQIWIHTLKRALILILLGVFLRSMHSSMTNWTFEDTLSQIGLGYPFLLLLANKSYKWIWVSHALLLVSYFLFFAVYPLPDANFNYELIGLNKDWEHNLSGFAGHWNKNTNAAWAFDTWFMNLFPREEPFIANGGGYSTLSFIPTLGTMIIGLIAGKQVYEKPKVNKLIKQQITLGLILIALGLTFHFIGINPIVKRIWTPSWVLFSGGICFAILALFTYLVDQKNIVKPFNWLKIIGMNSIAAYVIAHVAEGFIDNTFQIHLGENYANFLGGGYHTLVSGALILLVEWLLLKWMFKKGIFIKI